MRSSHPYWKTQLNQEIMFSSVTIEIALGLVFFYLLLSLLITTLNELIAAMFKFRGRHLRGAVTQMLGDKYKQLLYDHPLLEGTVNMRKTWWGKFFRTRLPSYMESKDFSKILTEIVAHELETHRRVAKKLQGGGGGSGSLKVNYENDNSDVNDQAEDIDTMSLDLVKDYIRRNSAAHKTLRLDQSEGLPTPGATLNVAAEVAAESKNISYGEAAFANLGNLANTISAMGFPESTKSVILSLAKKADGNLEAFKKELEVWFDNRMERTSGWYTRNLRLFTLGMSFVLVVALNADTLFVVKKLAHDSEARKKMIAMTMQSVTELEPLFAKDKMDSEGESNTTTSATADPISTDSADNASTPPNNTTSPKPSPMQKEDSLDVDKAIQLALRVDTLLNEDIQYASEILGLGWTDMNSPFGPEYRASQCKPLWLLKKLGGWLLTVIALSLGAPFWFDLLKRIVSIRTAGVNPDEKKEK